MKDTRMSDNEPKRISHAYFIQLPIAQAIELRDELKTTVWEIAQQEGVEETLREAQFDIQAGKTAIDPNTIITVIVTFVGTKVASSVTDKILEKAWEAWETKILPPLKQKFGKTALVDKDERKDSETTEEP